MKEKDQNIEIIQWKFFNNTSSREETEILLQWLDESKQNRLHYLRNKRIWLESNKDEKEKQHLDQSYERLKFRLENFRKDQSSQGRTISGIHWKIPAIASTIALLIIVTLFLGIKLESHERLSSRVNQISVPLGSRTKVSLPDGSLVWLNSGSELTYNLNFGKKIREISLSGEAFFDVKHFNKSPFIVKTSALEISVMGTQFNVKSYPDEKTVETLLIKGKVKINKRGGKDQFEQITLAPNQKMTYVKNIPGTNLESVKEEKRIKKGPVVVDHKKVIDESVNVISVIDPKTDISWKDEKLVIRSERLELIARKLERYYNVEIIFNDARIKDYIFTGTLDDVTIEEVLRAISTTSPISFKVNKNKVYLSPAR